jgi:hypothetical protein
MLAVLVPVQRAWPCGPDFPPVLLDNRGGTLQELPEGTFVAEVARLVPDPGDDFRMVEGSKEPERARTGGGAQEAELYQAGAQAFRAGGTAQARARFLEVLELPEQERRRFGPFAAYMLGRMAQSIEEAQRYFNEVRELVRKGSEDPLGLAVASFGEEGQALLREGEDVEAVRRYALQAAHGSQSGAISLLWVARALARDEERLRRALAHPLGQRLLTTYAWTRGRDSWWSGEEERHPLPGLLERLAAVPNLAGADRLAAAAWSAGRFDLAERFAGKVSPDWGWVDADYGLGHEESKGNKELTTQEESQRCAAHTPPHSVRFHYRSTAADLAEEAAALVPPRSQAYAALLCKAARFSSRSDPERTARLWKTYVQKGALLHEQWVFGQQCPEPDFARLKLKQEARPPPQKHWRRRTLAAAAGVVLLPLVAGGFLLLRRRRAGS